MLIRIVAVDYSVVMVNAMDVRIHARRDIICICVNEVVA